jgi:hypothetical protein
MVMRSETGVRSAARKSRPSDTSCTTNSIRPYWGSKIGNCGGHPTFKIPIKNSKLWNTIFLNEATRILIAWLTAWGQVYRPMKFKFKIKKLEYNFLTLTVDAYPSYSLSSRVYLFRIWAYFLRLWAVLGPPLWLNAQSSSLQTQRSRVRFSALSDSLSSGGSGTGLTQPREDKWGAPFKQRVAAPG